jgi:hypothetical protein
MNAQHGTNTDPALAELEATRKVYEALRSLTPDAQARALSHVSGLLNLDEGARSTHQQSQSPRTQEDAAIQREQKVAPKFANFAELFSAADPQTNAQKALVAGYWLQVCQGAETFDGQSDNRELKQLGHGLPNITAAIDDLKGQKPALALQVGKSGTSKQARKTYKLTVAGIKSVEEMIGG